MRPTTFATAVLALDAAIAALGLPIVADESRAAVDRSTRHYKGKVNSTPFSAFVGIEIADGKAAFNVSGTTVPTASEAAALLEVDVTARMGKCYSYATVRREAAMAAVNAQLSPALIFWIGRWMFCFGRVQTQVAKVPEDGEAHD